MKIPYCTCGKASKDIFSTGFLVFGITLHSVLAAAAIVLLLTEPGSFYFALLIGCLWVIWIWNKLELRHLALFLGHTKRCAARYSTLGAFATFKGVSPDYGEKKRGYRSLAYTVATRLLGKKLAKKTFWGISIIGWIAMAAGLFYISYDGLTRQRNGLPQQGTKYSPVISEAITFGVVLVAFGAYLYVYISKRIRHKSMIIGLVSIIMLSVWSAFIYGLSIYSRTNFLANLRDTFLIIAIVGGILWVIMAVENYLRRRKQKLRRRKNTARRA